MKIKVLSLTTKTALAIAVYYLAIVAFLALTGVIVLKTLFSPPCSIIGQHECVVDGWSVAGLAATILAVAATLLAILGAVAVAVWWTNLDKKVDERVDAQMKERVDQILEEQERNLQKLTTLLLQEQKKTFEETLVTVHNDIDVLNGLISSIDARSQATKDSFIRAITQMDPWIIEPWALDEMFLNPSSPVAVRMVLKYLKIVDGFFPSDPDDVSATEKHIESLKNRSAPYQTPISYWEEALAWQAKINSQLQPNQAEAAKREIEMRRANIESWKSPLILK